MWCRDEAKERMRDRKLNVRCEEGSKIELEGEKTDGGEMSSPVIFKQSEVVTVNIVLTKL